MVSFSGGEEAKSAEKMVNLTVTDDNGRSDCHSLRVTHSIRSASLRVEWKRRQEKKFYMGKERGLHSPSIAG